MIWFLRLLFAIVLVSMLWVTTWTSLHQPLGEFARSATFREPWVLATLLDAYWAFITFFVWVAWRERSLAARALWLVSILLLGNLATAAYLLRELCSVPARTSLGELLARRNEGHFALPGALAALAIGGYLLA